MPLFTGVGARIRDRLIALGYRQANGRPDVRRFCRTKGYDTALFYFWVNDENTPVKERARLAADLGMTEIELLFGVVPKARPGKARQPKTRVLWPALLLGAAAAMLPSPSVADTPRALSVVTPDVIVHLLGSWRRRIRNDFRSFAGGTAFAL